MQKALPCGALLERGAMLIASTPWQESASLLVPKEQKKPGPVSGKGEARPAH